LTVKEIQDLRNSSRDRVKDLTAVLEDWSLGMAGKNDATEIINSLKMLIDFSFSYGKYDTLYSVTLDKKMEGKK